MAANDTTVKYEPGKDEEQGTVEVNSPVKNRATVSAVAPVTAKKTPKRIPVLFDRASKTWWNPRFDSEILEVQHQDSSFPLTRRRFQVALFYIMTVCVAWCIFLVTSREGSWIEYMLGTIALLAVATGVLIFSYTKFYKNVPLLTSLLTSLVVCAFNLLTFAATDQRFAISGVGVFCSLVETILLMYTVIPMPLYLCFIISVVYSVIYEVLCAVILLQNNPQVIVGKVFMHVCIHVVGIHIFIMSQVRKRGTFLKVGQSMMSKRELQLEKQLTQKMIFSLMPGPVALEVMESKDKAERDSDEMEGGNGKNLKSVKQKGAIVFRSFHMSQMSNVSILFADIAGFTKMSSNKTAEHLVSLLNDLFGRFDELCNNTGCEKISTLGDCYYCVSGCPEPKDDHAKCCVEMGLGMITAIKEFDEDNNESVNMRVGIHTGTVLCGIVGTKRFKFDVWSNDVTLANTMESEGEPGEVHISEETYEFLKDEYEVRDGKEVKDIRHHKVLIEDYNAETNQYIVRHIQGQGIIKTFFIVGHKNPPTSPVVKEAPAVQDVPTPSSPDSVQIRVEGDPISAMEREPQENDPEVSTGKPESNHVDGQANGMSTAALLGRRENIKVSMENLVPPTDQDAEASESSLMRLPRKTVEQSDKQLIRCIQEDTGNQDYFYKPPINECTLNFLKAHHERQYRGHYLDDSPQSLATFAAPRFSALFDMIVSIIFLIAVSICCFLVFKISTQWIIVFVIVMLIEIILFFPLFYDACIKKPMAPSVEKLGRFFSSWYPRHIFGILLTSLPTIAVYSNFSCNHFEAYYCYLLLVSLLHYCNFTMLSSWMKSSLAALAGLVLVALLIIMPCKVEESMIIYNTTGASNTTSITSTEVDKYIISVTYEIILDVILLLFLIWFLNREFEISYRLSFHGDYEAARDKVIMQNEKEKTDWLLHNIVPEHVSEVLKGTSKYSKNHQDVGVIFAKITNFDEFYDESFEGGREYLRVLNELISDFEDLLNKEKYKDIEKIKTIGSCFMAASGLNWQTRVKNNDPNTHLYALMDFALDLLDVVDQFNAEIFNFDFEMCIGYNYGEVTAGVIGTTKLLYDIWGDTVNISSRMYSTGVSGRIQVTEHTAEKLKDKFEFEYRGQTKVKGKGVMNTYLLSKRKEGATYD